MSVTSRQIFWMMTSMQIIMTILLSTTPAFQTALQDAWLSVLVATGISGGIALVCIKLNALFPGETVFEYSPRIFGKWLGRVVSSLYLFFWIVLFGVILQQFKIFLLGTILPLTPPFVLVIPMVGAVMYLSLNGIEAIARCSEITGPIIILGVLVPILFSLNRMKLDHLLPFYVDSGWLNMMKGALPTAAFLGDCILLLVIVSFVHKERKLMSYAVWGVIASGLFTVLSALTCLLITGPQVNAEYSYPLLIVVRSISISGLVENMDAVLVSIWIISVFIKLTLYLFVSSYGTAQLFGFKSWRKVSWFVAAIGTVMGIFPLNYVESSIIFPVHLAVPYAFPVLMAGLPLLMLVIAHAKNGSKLPSS